jgi:hypothetical protein
LKLQGLLLELPQELPQELQEQQELRELQELEPALVQAGDASQLLFSQLVSSLSLYASQP